MRAVLVQAPGTGAGIALEVRPTPRVANGQVLVKLDAAALNHRDLYFVQGIQGRGMAPFTPGSDGAGVVADVGRAVDRIEEGDDVVIHPTLYCGRCWYCLRGEQPLCDDFQILGGPTDGTLAEYVVIPPANVFPRPPHLTPASAAAFPLALGTAWRALITRGQLRPGETVLIHGIGGGVALFALQIALALGCQVIVTSHSQSKLERARAVGALLGICYVSESVKERVLDATDGRGVDLVVDGVGTATLPVSFEVVRRGGRIVCLVRIAGESPRCRTAPSTGSRSVSSG